MKCIDCEKEYESISIQTCSLCNYHVCWKCSEDVGDLVLCQNCNNKHGWRYERKNDAN